MREPQLGRLSRAVDETEEKQGGVILGMPRADLVSRSKGSTGGTKCY